MSQAPLPYSPNRTTPNSEVNARTAVYLLLGFVMLAVGFWLAYQWQSGTGLFQRHVNLPQLGPAASWSELRSIADREATRLDKDAVLVQVDGEPVNTDARTPTSDMALYLRFTYTRPSRKPIWVSVVDVSPPVAAEVREDTGRSDPMGLAEYEQRKQSADRVWEMAKISPRDALTLTLAEGIKIKEQSGDLSPRLSLYSSSDWQENFGMPVIWNVMYNATVGPTIRPNMSRDTRFLLVRVNPTTGEIIESKLTESIATPTPATP